jgi:hypothetical protein
MNDEQRKCLDNNLVKFTKDLNLAEVVPYLVANNRILRDQHRDEVCDE